MNLHHILSHWQNLDNIWIKLEKKTFSSVLISSKNNYIQILFFFPPSYATLYVLEEKIVQLEGKMQK